MKSMYEIPVVEDGNFSICRKVMKQTRNQKLNFLSSILFDKNAKSADIITQRMAIDLISRDEIAAIYQAHPEIEARFIISSVQALRRYEDTTFDDFLLDVNVGNVDVHATAKGTQYIGAEVLDDGTIYRERELLRQRIYDMGARSIELEDKNPIVWLGRISAGRTCPDEILDYIEDNLSSKGGLDFYEATVR